MYAECAHLAALRVRASAGGERSLGRSGAHCGQPRCPDGAWYRCRLPAGDQATLLERLARHPWFFMGVGRGTLSFALTLVRTKVYSVVALYLHLMGLLHPLAQVFLRGNAVGLA